MASDDMNACVDDLVAHRPKNILAALVSDDGPHEGARDPGSKQQRLQLRRAVMLEMLKNKVWSRERDRELAARLGVKRNRVYKVRWDLQIIMKKFAKLQDFVEGKNKRKCKHCISMLHELDLQLKPGKEVMDMIEDLSQKK